MKLTDILKSSINQFLLRDIDREALERRIKELNRPNRFHRPNTCTKCNNEFEKVIKRYGKYCCNNCGYPVPSELEEKIKSMRELRPPRSQATPAAKKPPAKKPAAREQPPVEHYTQLPHWVRDEREGSPTYGQLIVNPKYEDTRPGEPESGFLKPAFKQGGLTSDDYYVR